MGFATDSIHAGQEPDRETGAVTTPIYQTSTYLQDGLGRHRGYEYARTHNPTRQALEANLATLETGTHGIAFASGMAAINAFMSLLSAGDHVVVSHNVYGGTYRLFEMVLRRFGLQFSWVDTSDLDALEEALRPETRLVVVETPTNPILVLSDLDAIASLCSDRGVMMVVDNTFLSPFLQRPIEHGADAVFHSTTKFLNGHSDSVGGIVVVKDAELAERLYFLQNAAGAILSPFDSWLVLRGVKTLAVRMRQHEDNARQIAEFLASDIRLEKVYYPGLADHPQHELARRQQDGFGALVSLETGSRERAARLLESVQLCTLAESLGGVETLISHPATMTHASVPEKDRLALGISDGLVRISVGIEDVEDLIDDLSSGLDAMESG